MSEVVAQEHLRSRQICRGFFYSTVESHLYDYSNITNVPQGLASRRYVISFPKDPIFTNGFSDPLEFVQTKFDQLISSSAIEALGASRTASFTDGQSGTAVGAQTRANTSHKDYTEALLRLHNPKARFSDVFSLSNLADSTKVALYRF